MNLDADKRHLNNWRKWPRSFLPGHMGGSLVFGSSVISVSLCFKFFYKAVRGRKCLKVIVSSRCNDPEINEAFFIKKKKGSSLFHPLTLTFSASPFSSSALAPLPRAISAMAGGHNLAAVAW